MSGLMLYLAGPGKTNEHTNQRVITGSDSLVQYTEEASLDKGVVMRMSRELDADKRRTGTEIPKGHVFHASLSLNPDDKQLNDEQWSEVAHDFMREMDFTEAQGKAPCAWVAVNHGLSANGNPHIHIAASMVREDGTKWNQHNMRRRAVSAARTLEEKHGLQLVGREHSSVTYVLGEKESLARRQAVAEHRQLVKNGKAGTPWEALTAQERRDAIAAKASVVMQPRVELARRVRGCAAAAADEGEFVRRMRREGLIVRPRFAEGSRTEVTGFSVAERPRFGERPVWYGGGKLGKDLGLPALRQKWDGSVEAAAPEWVAAAKGRAPVQRGAERSTAVSGDVMVAYAQEVTMLLGKLKDASASPETYAAVAHEGAGMFSAWANQAGFEGDKAAADLQRAADAFAASAQLKDQPRQAVTASSGASRALAGHLSIGMDRRAGAVAVVRMWSHVGKSLGQVLEARGDALRARALMRDTSESLTRVHDAYRVINPLPVAATPPAAPTTTRTVGGDTRAQALEAEQQRLARLTETLRAKGLPEDVIAAQLHAERQHARPVAGVSPTRKPGSSNEPAGVRVTQPVPQPAPRIENNQPRRKL